MKLLNLSEGAFKKVQAPIYVRLALGGLAVGLIAGWFPGGWGNGYVITNRILQGEYGAPAFSAGDIANLESLGHKLKQPTEDDGVSKYLATQLAPATLNLLSNYTGNGDMKLQKALSADLN